MMKSKYKNSNRLLALLAALLLPLVMSTMAAAAPVAAGLEVTPIKNNIAVDSGTTTQVPITVTNNYKQKLVIQSTAYDLNLTPQGQEQVLINGQTSPEHSLKNDIKAIPDFSLAAGVSQIVPVAVTIPASLATGTYEATVVFRPAPNTSGSVPALSSGVGTIIVASVTHHAISAQPHPTTASHASSWNVKKMLWLGVIVLLVVLEVVLIQQYRKVLKKFKNDDTPKQ